MNKLLIPILLLIALNGNGQIFEIEYGGGIQYANIIRKSLSSKLGFQQNERYYTQPGLSILFRMSFGQDASRVRFLMQGHINIDYTMDKDRFFDNTLRNGDTQGIHHRFSQYSLYFGPRFSLVNVGPIQLQLGLGMGMSSIRMPSIVFGSDNSNQPHLFSYEAHGGLGMGGLAEGSIAYVFSKKIKLAMTFTYHGGRIYNTSVETWLTGEVWNKTQDVPAPNIIAWKNTLLSWSFVYAIF